MAASHDNEGLLEVPRHRAGEKVRRTMTLYPDAPARYSRAPVLADYLLEAEIRRNQRRERWAEAAFSVAVGVVIIMAGVWWLI